MVARRIAWSVSLAAVTVVGAALPFAGLAQARSASAQSAQAFKHYTNARPRYTISYPAGWKVAAASGLDLFVGAPDAHAFLTASAIPTAGSTVTAAQIKQQQKTVLVGQHVVPSTITYDVRSINGMKYQIAEGVAKANGRYMDLILVDTVRKGYIFDFNAGVVLKVGSTDAETKLLISSLNSIRLS